MTSPTPSPPQTPSVDSYRARRSWEDLASEYFAKMLLGMLPGGSTFQTKFDYGARTDANPIYIGKSTETSLDTDPNWVITQFTWDTTAGVSARPTVIKVLEGAWSNRASLSW